MEQMRTIPNLAALPVSLGAEFAPNATHQPAWSQLATARRDLVKKVKAEAETGKIAIRNIRKDANEKIRKLKSEGVSEDEMKTGEGEIQKLTDSYIVKVDQHAEAKEKDVMTV